MLIAIFVIGSWMIFVIPIPTIITVVTMVVILISARTKKDTK